MPQAMSNIGAREVDNPYFGPAAPLEHKVVGVTTAHRDDPLGNMYDRGQINQPQCRAGRRWQTEWEASGRDGPIKAQDPTLVVVDGSRRFASGTTDRQLRASNNLNRWERLLGESGWRLIGAVLGDKRTVHQATMTIYGEVTRSNLAYAGRRFRECLDSLARDLGLAP